MLLNNDRQKMWREREEYDMQQRSPAGIETATVAITQSCGMCYNHSASKASAASATTLG